MASLVALIVFGLVMLGIGLFARGRVSTVEDYVVAGRRLGLGLAVPTLLATWFGAGTLLVAADEVRAEGLRAAALDPLGAGVCLLLAAALLARPLWEAKLTTLPDFFARTYGPTAERWASLLMVPGYLGWTAAQFTALAGLLTAVAGVDPDVALVSVAGVGLAYTLLGGMWAVTLTDAAQMAGVVIGLVVLFVAILLELGQGSPGAGAIQLWEGTAPEKRVWIPSGAAGVAWGSAFVAGAFGNLPGQDLTQRIFAARSARTAQLACAIAGVAYLVLGLIPLALALGVEQIAPELHDQPVLTVLAGALLHPAVAVVFVLTVASAVLSTIDSAILAPSTVIAHNLAGHRVVETVALHRWAVAGVATASLVVAFLGEDAWSILETSYELGLVSLLVPLLLGLYAPRTEASCLAAMALGTASWGVHLALELDGFLGTWFPVGVGCAGLAVLGYLGAGRAISD